MSRLNNYSRYLRNAPTPAKEYKPSPFDRYARKPTNDLGTVSKVIEAEVARRVGEALANIKPLYPIMQNGEVTELKARIAQLEALAGMGNKSAPEDWSFQFERDGAGQVRAFTASNGSKTIRQSVQRNGIGQIVRTVPEDEVKR